ncbi:AAA-like domain-containing protein [Halogranum amylolyticum]|uniref:AAA-like domain-containing protein n=1 Tax=Halogranum amylolyticum TaxID=660520 RepID=A0A1H8WTE1_9EURY|nr:type IV secretion system DNA-binding domain-containing protein [Halogranum amylolyticum]SEP30974.1 AAA-like domain-containing protein [Halogranum amylolyticum]
MSLFGSDDAYDTVTLAAPDVAPQADAIQVRPHKDSEGIANATELLTSLHNVETNSRRLRSDQNVSPAHAFEMRYTNERVNFQFIPGKDGLESAFERQIQNHYPNAQLHRDSDAEFIGLEEDVHVSGAELSTTRYTLFPIRHVELEGFDTDPFGSITSEMVGTMRDDKADCEVVVQVLFKPAMQSWVDGVDGGESLDEIAHELKQPTLKKERRLFTKEVVEYDPSPQEKKAAKILGNQHGEHAWRLNIRVFAASPDETVAKNRAERAAEMFGNYYESSTKQGLEATPLTGKHLRETLQKAAAREYEEQQLVKSQSETAGLVHVPNGDINTANVAWSLSRSGDGIPPGTPRFDFEDHGVASASAAEKQVAMMNTTDPTQPYWYGRGTKNGTEAGIEPDVLNVHQFVGGATGKGKTTLLKNYFYQVLKRGHGGMFFDPKGRDADDILSIVPEDREDDVVFVDLGGDHDKQVGFNFLENPVEGTVDPDSEAFASAIESVADDLAALLAQAGGSDNYWGALMERVTKNLARGFAKSPWELTILDMYYALSNEDARQRYASHLSDERIAFIEDYARNQLSEMDDDKLEPLLGRLQQWVENDVIRELIAHPESTVSVEDVIDDGGIIIVRNQTSGETVKRMFATALIRRAWVAVRENPKAPPFFVVCDEFDSIVTEESSIHTILSEARAFDFSITLACQNPSNQLPDRIAKSIQNQCQTFLSFNPGGPDDAKVIAAQHSKDIEWDDLTNMSKYRIYMRTHDENDQLTHSYKVDAFPPIDEVANENIARSEAETEQLISDLLDKHGTRRRTNAEIKSESRFHPSEGGGPSRDTDDEAVASADTDAAVKAVYDESIRANGEGCTWVSADAATDRIQRYVESELSLGQLWDALESIPSDVLEVEERDDGMYLRTTPTGETRILGTGDSENTGGGKHRQLLKDAYDPLTKLGLVVSLPNQDGTDMPDGLIDPVDVTPETEGMGMSEIAQAYAQFTDEHPVVSRLTDGDVAALEAESSTSTKPAQTVRNLAKAVDREQHCVFLAREENAQTVYDALTDPPYVAAERDDGRQVVYNHKALRIDGERVYVEDTGAQRTVWVYDPATGQLALEDSSGEAHATFDSPNDAWTDASGYPTTESAIDDEEGWRRVYQPRVPERLFDGEVPDAETWTVIAVERGAESAADLTILDDTERSPPDETAGTDSTKDDPIGKQTDETDVATSEESATAESVFAELQELDK